MILSTSAIKFAEAQFILAIVIFPQAALATFPKEVRPNTTASERSILLIFIISPTFDSLKVKLNILRIIMQI